MGAAALQLLELPLHVERGKEGGVVLVAGSVVADVVGFVLASGSSLTGKELPILRPEQSGPLPEPLIYSCDKLKSTGFSLTSQVPQEIDATLGFCMTAFGT